MGLSAVVTDASNVGPRIYEGILVTNQDLVVRDVARAVTVETATAVRDGGVN